MDLKHPIQSKTDLVTYLESGCTPRKNWGVGTERESFLFLKNKLTRAVYSGDHGIKAVLQSFRAFGWQDIYEGDYLIALQKNKATITIEPGGQIEFSGSICPHIHDVALEQQAFQEQLEVVAKKLGLFIFEGGVDPISTLNDIPWMPKQRYQIMKSYLPTKATLGLHMMKATCSHQTSLDFESEQDMAQKFRIGLALQPIVSVLFANAPIFNGQVTGYKSYRNYIWQHTDPDRCGLLPFVFEEQMTFEKYVDYALATPMFFLVRDNIYHPAEGKTFQDFLDGKFPEFKKESPTLGDFETHLSTLFPEVRLKHVLEMRGTDGGSPDFVSALSALWVGLLYVPEILDQIYNLIQSWTYQECLTLSETAPTQGLATPFKEKTVKDYAHLILKLAQEGLKQRAILKENGQDETIYLLPLEKVLDEEKTRADLFLEQFTNQWDQNINHFFQAKSLAGTISS